MERTEWPTSSKIETLRESGCVPFSPVAIRAFACAGVALGVYAGYSTWAHFVFAEELVFPHGSAAPSQSPALFNRVIYALCLPVLFALVGAIVCGLTQTKFYFSLGRCAFDIRRVNPFRVPDLGKLMGGCGREMTALFVGVTLTIVALWIGIPRVLQALNHGETFLQSMLGQVLRAALWCTIAVSVLTAVVGYLAERTGFMWQHRMTKREVEAESRE